MFCTLYKDLQQFITILVHPNFTTCLQTTQQQPNTAPHNSVYTIIWRTNSLRPMTMISITFTFKSKNWFFETNFSDICMHWYDQVLRHNILCITTNWTVSYTPADVCIFATFLYYISEYIHCISVPCYNTNQRRFSWNRYFPVIFSILK